MVRKLYLYVSLTQSVRLMAQLVHNEAQLFEKLVDFDFSYLENKKRYITDKKTFAIVKIPANPQITGCSF